MFPAAVIIGEKVPRLAGTTLISYPGIHGQAVQIELESGAVVLDGTEPLTTEALAAAVDEAGYRLVEVPS